MIKNRLFRALLISTGLLLATFFALFLYSRPWPNALFMRPLYQLSTTEKVVPLTFDDGPSKERTPILLDLLRQHSVKATFFMLGKNIEQYPEIARRVLAEGHLIGNHSYDHPKMYFKSPAYLRAQIETTDSLIRSLGQAEVPYFRPPYSAKFIVLPLLLKSQNKILVTGTYDPPSEYKTPYPADAVAKEVLLNASPGCIIYLHDGKASDPAAFVESVEQIIVGMKASGYRFVSLEHGK